MPLSPELALRRPTMDDLAGVAALVRACDVTHQGTDLGDASDDFRQTWTDPGFKLDEYAWVVVTNEGQIVGYQEFWPQDETLKKIELDGYVHPAWTGHGIGTCLLDLIENRFAGTGAVADLQVQAIDTASVDFFRERGFTWARGLWVMEIELTAPPPAPVWPAGVTLVPFTVEQYGHTYHEMIESAFLDHWDFSPHSYEEWSARFGRSDFDPMLYFLLLTPQGIGAGGSNCRLRTPEFGWVQGLGVRREWRKQGLGQALLYHTFGEFYRRGVHTVGLAVDSESLTGATRLYERVGMHVTDQYDSYSRTF